MTSYLRIALLLFIFFYSCKSSPSQQGASKELAELCAAIRNAPEAASTDKTSDDKFHLLKQLKNFKSDEACDSMKAIFLSLESWEYKYEPLYVLSDHNTEKSRLVLSEIIRDYPLDHPANMFFIWNLVMKPDNTAVMFPNLAMSLGKQKWTDGHVLSIIGQAYRKKEITRQQLESSKPYLIAFYEYLKIEKNSLAGSKHYAEYYDSHVTDLLFCLRVFEPDEKINAIYRDVLRINSSFSKFCSVSFTSYNNYSKRKLTALLQAALGLLQNNQPVEEKYLELIAAEPLYHNELYEGMVKINKHSLFPKKYMSQESFASSDLLHSKQTRRDQATPDCLELLGKREITSGRNAGVYYFYNAKYNDNNKILLSVSGPQPPNPDHFSVSASKTNNIYGGELNKGQVNAAIDKIIKDLDN